MTVHALVPVFNRLAMTQAIIGCLRKQVLDEPLQIVVIDDGSSDGTAEYLKTETDLTVLQGDGHLWWAGAIDLGLKHVLANAPASDWVALINNDTSFAPDFLQNLLDAARTAAPAAVGSILCDEKAPEHVLSIGPLIDSRRFKIADRLQEHHQIRPDDTLYDVDALSGRGALYAVAAVRAAGGMRPRMLPHYLADYELALRVARAGYRLVVSGRAVTLSNSDFGNLRKPMNISQKLLSIRSPFYLPAMLGFWWSASTPGGRWSVLPRLAYASLTKNFQAERR